MPDRPIGPQAAAPAEGAGKWGTRANGLGAWATGLGATASAALAAGMLHASPSPGPAGLALALGAVAVAMPLVLGLALRQRVRQCADQDRQLQAQQASLQALASQARQLNLAEQVAQLGSFDWNPASGALHWSDQHFRLWGHAPGSLQPDYEAFRRSVHPDDLTALEAQLQQALQGGGHYDCNHRVCWPDGTVRDVHARGEVSFDAAGQAVRMIGTVQDVTERRRADARLQMHEFVLNTITDPISVIDAERVYLLVNQAWSQVTGLTPDQVVGQPPGLVQRRVASPDRDEALRRCLQQNQVQVLLAELDVAGTGKRWWETTMFPFTQPHSGRRGAALISRDVTATQAAARALEASVDNLRLTLNATGDAIFASDATAPNEPLLFVNDRMLALWNIPPDQAAGLTPAGVMAAARPYFTNPEREFARIAEVIASSGLQEDRLSLNDGRVLLRRCIPTRQAGRQVRVWGFRDITVESRALAGLRAAEAQQRALLSAFPGHIACVDAAQRVTYVNARMAALLGGQAGNLIGQPVGDLTGGPASPAMARRFARALDGEVLRFELQHPARQDQPETHVLYTLARGTDRATGELLCFVFGTDITPQKHTEAALVAARDEAQRANRAKSAFLSNLSHELRSPMSAVLGYAQLLATASRPPLPTELAGHVREILRGGQHLLTLVNDLLDLARIEANHLAVTMQPVALGPLLADCLRQLAPEAQRRRITLHAPEPAWAGAVMADPTRLRQVLLNLLGNAVKFNHDGGWVRLGCAPQGDRLRLWVADGGPGIAAALRPRLFQRFDRLGAERGTVDGAGLGLALSQGLLALMGGEIGLDEPDTDSPGCRFWLSLAIAPPPDDAADPAAGPVAATTAAPALTPPIAAPADVPAQEPAMPLPVMPTARPAAAATTTAAPLQVLYIDDTPVNALLMAAMFERLPGLQLHCMSQPQAGLDRALAQPPDLLLLDIQMPGLDGYEVLRRLRADPATSEVPVIAVSANAMPQDLARGRAAGFADYLTKPLELPRLLAALQAVLPGWVPGGEAGDPLR